MLSLARNNQAWQLILADLALILFLMTAAALSTSQDLDEPPKPESGQTATLLAPAQSLYRAGPGLPTLAQWLEQQQRDPRAALTIVAQHAPGEEERAWSEARSMATTARSMGVRTRVIIRVGKANAVHASLAYDQLAP